MTNNLDVNRITQLTPESINRCIFIGAPGIGKTEELRRYAEKVAKEKGRKFVDLRVEKDIDDVEHNYYYLRIIAPHVFPEDLSIPNKTENGIILTSPKIIDILTRENAEGLVFIDEINNVQRSDQRVIFYALIQEGEIGWGTRLNDKIVIVAAGNTPEWSSDAVSLPNPLINRMVKITVEPPSIRSWVNYMDTHHPTYDRRTAAFLSSFPAYFIKRPEEEDLANFPTPRSWTNLAVRLNKEMDKELIYSIVEGTIGSEASTYFLEFIKTQIPSFEDIIANPLLFKRLNISQQMMLIYEMAQRYTEFKEMGGEKVIDEWRNSNRDSILLLVSLVPKSKRVEYFGVEFFNEFALELAAYVH